MLTLIRPANAHSAYAAAAEEFVSLARKVSGQTPAVVTDLEALKTRPEGELVLLGTDAVNRFSGELWLAGEIGDFDVRCGSEDYCVRSETVGGQRVLLLAAGRPRAALYAVYRYFEQFCGCRWFWDGDRIPGGPLPLDGLYLKESPRFEYRGLRYFAHRSLRRFQAEHWGLADWQREIDWMLKKRFNLFMLRIGMDDLYQRAFPELVDYPDRDKPLPEAGPGYDDRTLFWSLQYRGELRKKLLAYAFDRDMMHPEDCGTMTHWYCRTPLQYLDKVQPALLTQSTPGYNQRTGLVWDIRDDKNLEAYFKLTETHVREFGRPELFHTIGLAERNFYDDRERNLKLKVNVYRRIAGYLQAHYPNAKLFLASWDMWMYYQPDEVKRLLEGLDKKQCVLLDYTSDTVADNNFTKWGVEGSFPWVFGIFSAYEWQSDVRGRWSLIQERLARAKQDDACVGMILWPELSHGDSFAGEYTAYHAWNSDLPTMDEMLERHCAGRYPAAFAGRMLALWKRFLPIGALRSWHDDPDYAVNPYELSMRLNVTLAYLNQVLPADTAARAETPLANAEAQREAAAAVLEEIAALLPEAEDPMLRRDLFDLGRSVLSGCNEYLLLTCLRDCELGRAPRLESDSAAARVCMRALRDLLAGHEDYSMRATLEGLRDEAPVNPDFERTLKNNASCWYCRSYIWENAACLYVPELDALLEELAAALREGRARDFENLRAADEAIVKAYFDTPLRDMRAAGDTPERALLKAAEALKSVRFS